MKKWLGFLFVLLALVLNACAPVGSYHVFYFDARENKSVKVLDWRYGNYGPGSRYVKLAQTQELGLAGDSVSLKEVGDYFFVKWMIPPLPEVHELNIDLRHLLPWNMAGAEVRPSFSSSGELEIYLAVPDPKAPNTQIFRNHLYAKSVVYRIYPNRKFIEPGVEGGRR